MFFQKLDLNSKWVFFGRPCAKTPTAPFFAPFFMTQMPRSPWDPCETLPGAVKSLNFGSLTTLTSAQGLRQRNHIPLSLMLVGNGWHLIILSTSEIFTNYIRLSHDFLFGFQSSFWSRILQPSTVKSCNILIGKIVIFGGHMWHWNFATKKKKQFPDGPKNHGDSGLNDFDFDGLWWASSKNELNVINHQLLRVSNKEDPLNMCPEMAPMGPKNCNVH